MTYQSLVLVGPIRICYRKISDIHKYYSAVSTGTSRWTFIHFSLYPIKKFFCSYESLHRIIPLTSLLWRQSAGGKDRWIGSIYERIIGFRCVAPSSLALIS